MIKSVLLDLCVFICFQLVFFDVLLPWVAPVSPLLSTILQLATVVVVVARLVIDLRAIRKRKNK